MKNTVNKTSRHPRRVLSFFCLLLCCVLFSGTVLAADTASVQSGVTTATPAPLQAGYINYTFDDLSLVIQIPEDAIVLTPYTPLTSAKWAQAGIDDPETTVNNYTEVGVVAEIATVDAGNHVKVIATQTDTTKSIYTFNDYSEDQLNQYFEQLAQSDGGYIEMTCTGYKHAQTTFFCLDTKAVEDKLGQTFRELLYGTIINGGSVVFDIYEESGVITDDQISFLTAMVESSRFTQVLARPETVYSSTQIILALVVVIVLIALVVGFFLFSFLRKKKNKDSEKDYADRLTRYRTTKKVPGAPAAEATALFVNTTEQSDEAIATFASFQAYWRNPFGWLYYIFISAAAVLVCFLSGSDWWIKLALVCVFGYSIYYTTTLGRKIRTKITEVIRRVPTRKAVFTFFNDEFRIAGMQTSNLFPYFQITEVREFKNYIYLYFGSDTTYYVDKNNFAIGDADRFAEFLHTKLGKRFRHYKKRGNRV